MANDSEDEESLEEREAKARAFMKQQADRATQLRSKEREFHGLERESRYDQAEMLGAYAKTKDMKHPRDMGAARENILRKYLNERGLLPKRYAVSDLSFRAVSTTGHMSPELDIALYDPLNSIRLMVREDMFEVLPIESVYGAIQVKSRLNRKEIREGLANLASVKRLKKNPGPAAGFKLIQGIPKSGHAFGILFAFDSDLEWLEIIKEIEAFAQAHPKTEWANAIFILNKGFFLYGDKVRGGRPENAAIEAIGEFQIYGIPDREELCLSSFSSTLLGLLRNTEVYPVDMDVDCTPVLRRGNSGIGCFKVSSAIVRSSTQRL